MAGTNHPTEEVRLERPTPRAGGTAALLAGAGIATLLSFAYNVWCGRRLGSVQYADLAAALAIAGVLAYALNPLGLVTSQVASRLFGAGDLCGIRRLYLAMQKRTLAGIAIASLLVFPLVWISTPLLRFESRGVPLLTYLVVSTLLLLGLARGTLRALHRFQTYTRGLIAEAILRLGIGVPLVWISPGATQALIGYAASAAAVLAIHDRSVRRIAPQAEVRTARTDAAGPLVGAAWALLLGYALGQNVDLLVVKSVAAGSDAGSYAAAWTLARGLMVLTMPLDALLFPRLGINPNPADALGRLGLLFALLWAAPLALAVAMPGTIVTTLFGRSYAEAAALLPWLAAATMLLSFSYLTGQALLFMQQPRFLVTMFFGLILEVALVARAGGDLVATARAVALAQILIAAGNAFWLYRAVASRRGAA